jgi:hypothetical protein
VKKLRRLVSCSIVFVMLALPSELPSAPRRACELDVGDRIVLAADTADPDVFVWDSRARLLSYVAGEWKSTKDVLAHTALIDPGTLAVVVFCNAGVGRPKYNGIDEDIVGVRLLTGSRRNLWGWVRSSDVHAMRVRNKRHAS